MSNILATGAYGGTSIEQSSQSRVSGNVRKDDFLLLLITQLKNQDPLAPLEDKEFIAQLAQFSVLEELQDLSKNVAGSLQVNKYYQSMNTAMELLGCHVKAMDERDETILEGIVTKVGFKDYAWRLYLEDGREVSLSQIIEAKKV